MGNEASKALGKKAISIKIPHFLIFIIGYIGQFFESMFGWNVDLNKDRAYRLTRPSWYCNCAKAVRDFGLEQTKSLEQGFKETADWYKEKGWI